MRKVNSIILIAILLALVLGFLLTIGADTDNPDAKIPVEDIGIELSREEIPKLVEIIRIWKLVDDLELKEEQLATFLPRFKELNDLRNKHYRSRREALTKLRVLLEKNSSESKIKPAMDDLRKAEEQFLQKEKQLGDALNSSLTVKQQAMFVVFQDVYRRDMQRLMRNLQELSRLKERRSRPQPVPSKEKKEN